MSDVIASDHVVADWVGCLVLTVAPKPYMPEVADAVLRAERTIFGDPVLVDMARVATTSTPDPLGGDLDDIALGLDDELVTWAQSPARNPAPRFTFCVLLLHPDLEEADRLVRKLAATSVLSEVPIIFQIGGLAPTPRSPVGVSTGADENESVPRMILDAVTATAHEVDKTPSFCLTASQLAAIVAGRRSRPAPSPAPILEQRPPEIASTPSPARDASGHSTSFPRETIGPTPAPADSAAALSAAVDDQADVPTTLANGGAPPADTNLEVGARRQWAGRTALGDRAGSLRSLFTRRRLPATGIEVINDLSGRADRVSMLYIVFVSEPVRPSRKHRKVRIELAVTLVRTLMSDPDSDREPWYVRAFTSDRELHAGSPLPAPDLLRHKDFPQRWGEHFDLYDSVGDIVESIDRDTSSFVRRGLQPPRTIVVFLSGPAPGGGADSARRLADLCAVAETIWVSFSRNAPIPDNFSSVGAHFLRNHEDLLDELLRLIGGRPGSDPTPPPSIDESAQPFFEPSEAGSPGDTWHGR